MYLYLDFGKLSYLITDKKKKATKDTKGIIKWHKSKKDVQYNGQKKKDKRTNNDVENYKSSKNANPHKRSGVNSGAHDA